MNIKKIWLKIISKKRYDKYKAENTKIKNKNLYNNKIKKKLHEINNVLKNTNDVSFLHS